MKIHQYKRDSFGALAWTLQHEVLEAPRTAQMKTYPQLSRTFRLRGILTHAEAIKNRMTGNFDDDRFIL